MADEEMISTVIHMASKRMSARDWDLVVRMFKRYEPRARALLVAYEGEPASIDDLVRLILRIARRLEREGGIVAT